MSFDKIEQEYEQDIIKFKEELFKISLNLIDEKDLRNKYNKNFIISTIIESLLLVSLVFNNIFPLGELILNLNIISIITFLYVGVKNYDNLNKEKRKIDKINNRISELDYDISYLTQEISKIERQKESLNNNDNVIPLKEFINNNYKNVKVLTRKKSDINDYAR